MPPRKKRKRNKDEQKDTPSKKKNHKEAKSEFEDCDAECSGECTRCDAIVCTENIRRHRPSTSCFEEPCWDSTGTLQYSHFVPEFTYVCDNCIDKHKKWHAIQEEIQMKKQEIIDLEDEAEATCCL